MLADIVDWVVQVLIFFESSCRIGFQKYRMIPSNQLPSNCLILAEECNQEGDRQHDAGEVCPDLWTGMWSQAPVPKIIRTMWPCNSPIAPQHCCFFPNRKWLIMATDYFTRWSWNYLHIRIEFRIFLLFCDTLANKTPSAFWWWIGGALCHKGEPYFRQVGVLCFFVRHHNAWGHHYAEVQKIHMVWRYVKKCYPLINRKYSLYNVGFISKKAKVMFQTEKNLSLRHPHLEQPGLWRPDSTWMGFNRWCVCFISQRQNILIDKAISPLWIREFMNLGGGSIRGGGSNDPPMFFCPLVSYQVGITKTQNQKDTVQNLQTLQKMDEWSRFRSIFLKETIPPHPLLSHRDVSMVYADVVSRGFFFFSVQALTSLWMYLLALILPS